MAVLCSRVTERLQDFATMAFNICDLQTITYSDLKRFNSSHAECLGFRIKVVSEKKKVTPT